MTNVSMSGNIIARVNGSDVPIRFYGNVVEVSINSFSVLLECIKLIKFIINTSFESRLKKSIRVSVKSSNIIISLISKFIKLF